LNVAINVVFVCIRNVSLALVDATAPDQPWKNAPGFGFASAV